MKSNIGAMRHRITIKSVERVDDDYGGSARSDEVIDPFWGDIQPMSAREIYTYNQLQQRTTHKIMARYRNDIKQGMTLEHNGISYYVSSVVNRDQQKRYIEILCREGGPN